MPAPPRPDRRPVETTLHGDTRVDPYAWLRDRDDPRVRAQLEAENAYTEAVMAPGASLVSALYDEMVGRIQQTDRSAPAPRGDWEYYRRTVEGKEYGIECRRPRGGDDSGEQVLVDGNALVVGHEYLSVGVVTVSPDGRILAFSVDVDGSESYTIRFRDLASGEDLPDRIPNTKWSLCWANDGSVLYTVPDAIDRPYQVRRHVLGADPATDAVLFEEADPRFYVSVGRGDDERRLLIHSGGKTTTEVHWLDADAPTAVSLLVPREEGVLAYAESADDVFLVRTNRDATEFVVKVARPGVAEADWPALVPYDPAVNVRSVSAFAGYIVLGERYRGLDRLRVVDRSTGAQRLLEFDEPAYALSAKENLEYDTTVFRFGYSSLVTPASVYDEDLATGERQLRKRTPVLGYDPSGYRVERVWATADDGTRVPISLAGRADVPRDGTAPCLLFGYGSYGMAYDPSFRSTFVSMLDRGVVVALAHIRGGGDMGRAWYEAAKFTTKSLTFSDFVACTEHLKAEGLVGPVVASGGSAGGLLMGAVLNLRPDLYRGILARVPFVDALNTMLDASLPLTVTEYDEWGNPEQAEIYAAMRAYSPYDNVGAANYPPVLATGGLNDPRVGYWEPAKWVARLRDETTGDAPILFKVNLGAGHGGASGRYEYLREAAFEYAWVARTLEVA
ncbi:MAG: oligopeptidase B [Myxococcota bacterium]|jgi:oligopeptidase B